MNGKQQKDWRIWYWVLLLFLLGQILFYYWFTQHWS